MAPMRVTPWFTRVRSKMRMLPSIFLYDKCRLLMGPGVVINPEIVLQEVQSTRSADRVGVDPQCAVIEHACLVDRRKELEG